MSRFCPDLTIRCTLSLCSCAHTAMWLLISTLNIQCVCTLTLTVAIRSLNRFCQHHFDLFNQICCEGWRGCQRVEDHRQYHYRHPWQGGDVVGEGNLFEQASKFRCLTGVSSSGSLIWARLPSLSSTRLTSWSPHRLVLWCRFVMMDLLTNIDLSLIFRDTKTKVSESTRILDLIARCCFSLLLMIR